MGLRLWRLRFHRAAVLAMGKVGVGLGWPCIGSKSYRNQSLRLGHHFCHLKAQTRKGFASLTDGFTTCLQK